MLRDLAAARQTAKRRTDLPVRPGRRFRTGANRAETCRLSARAFRIERQPHGDC